MSQNVPGRFGVLVGKLRDLHLHAGEPSMRAIAARTAGVVSHSTVHQTLSGKRVPRWGALELIVEALGGDSADFHSIWKEVRLEARQVPQTRITEPAESVNYRFTLARTTSSVKAENYLTFEQTRSIKEAQGALAAAEYLGKKIGSEWSSPLMSAYIPLLEEAGRGVEVDNLVPHFRGIEMNGAEASHVVAGIFDELDESAEALRHERAALRQDPNNAYYAWMVGAYLEGLDSHDEAHSYYRLAYRLDPGELENVRSYISSLLSRSEFSEVEAVARSLWNDEAVRVYAGIALALQGAFTEAESVFSSISKHNSGGARAYAQVLVALGRREDALSLLANQLEKYPNDLSSATVYAELLREAGAMEAHATALRRLEAGIAREREQRAELWAKISEGNRS
jgi:tetratricopeptide (TPR) repeat protein